MTEAHTHGAEELCAEGLGLYVRALRDGRVAVEDAEKSPCLVDLGLLHSDVEDPGFLRPVPPASVLHRLLRRRRSASRTSDGVRNAWSPSSNR